MGRYFGTDGIRGEANEKLTCDLALRVGKALTALKEKKVILGYDTRLSNHMLANAISSGALSFGMDVTDVGVITTPGLSYLSKKYETIGVMITASHNPYQDNGIKIFYHGIKMTDEQETKLEELIDQPSYEYPIPFNGKFVFDSSMSDEYINYLLSIAPKSTKKIVLDCANGASYRIAPFVYSHVTSNLIVIGNEPDGYNINKEVGSTHLEALKARVLKENADVGFAYDGDSDRLLVIDDKGKEVTGDEIIYIIASQLKKMDKLKHDTVVLTIMSNLGIIQALNKQGIHVVTTNVGDRNVLLEMLKHGYVVGGENSGHIINLEYLHTGDGIISSLILLSILEQTGKSIEELTTSLALYPDRMVNLKVKDKNIANLDQIQTIVKKINQDGNGDVHLIIRASGTENLLRISCCAKDERKMNTIIDEMVALIQKFDK